MNQSSFDRGPLLPDGDDPDLTINETDSASLDDDFIGRLQPKIPVLTEDHTIFDEITAETDSIEVEQTLSFGGSSPSKDLDGMLADGLLSEKEIHGLVESMRKEFGLRELDVYHKPGWNNAGQTIGEDPRFSYDDGIHYGSNFVVEMSKEYGSEVVPGIIGHEVGHTLTKLNISAHDKEFAADLVSGMLSARQNVSPEAMEKFYLSPSMLTESATHPAGLDRLCKFQEGFKLATENPDIPLKNLLEQSSVSDDIDYRSITFDVIFSKPKRNYDEDIASDHVTFSSTDDPDDLNIDSEDIFAGAIMSQEPTFKGGLGICGIKCISNNVTSSDYWSSELNS